MADFARRRLRLWFVLLGVAMGAGALADAAATASAVPSNPDDRTIIHVLNRIGFGPAPGDVAKVRKTGLARYIDDQLHPERVPNTALSARLGRFDTLALSSEELARDYFMPAQRERRRAQQAAGDPAMRPPDGTAPPNREMRTPAQMEAARAAREVFTDLAEHKIVRAAYSERQLEEVMVDFWFNHFNVFAGKGQTRVYLTEYERDTIRPRVLGKFRDLLGATAESPAMLFYLDNWQSAAPSGSRTERRRPDRPAFGRGGRAPRRPLTLADAPQAQRPERGLNENYARELMELHTLGVDGGYTQKDVQEVARAFTGWTIANPRQGGGFRYEPRMHDDGDKVVLGHRLKAGGGRKDGEAVLDVLAEHPATARFVSTKLVRRFVADTPPTALVDRAAARFRETKGDIREVLRTILTSPEFFAADAYRAKTKTPLEFVVSAVRASGAEAVNVLPLVNALREMGMPPYQCQPPTGYADRGDAWVNTGALLARMNFALALASGRMPGIRPNGLNAEAPQVRSAIAEGVLADDLADSTRATVARATSTPQLAALLLGSPEFQKR